MAWYLNANGTADYVQGDLVSTFSGDFTLKFVGTIDAFNTSGSDFQNLLAVADDSGSDYLGLAINNSSPWNKLKIISDGNTPGAGTTTLVAGQEYTITLEYDQSANLASAYIDGVFEYSVNPTDGATWVPTCDVWRLFSASASTSFGDATVRDGTQIIDIDTPANTIEPTPTLSGGSGLVLPDASANGEDGTLFGFSGDEWQLSERDVTDSAIPNITTQTVQGFCRDASYFYMFDTTASGGFVDEINKVDLTGTIVTTNSTPYSSLPSPTGTWKLNDGFEDSGTIYNIVADSGSSDFLLVKYSASTLAYSSHVDITSTGSGGAGCCIGHTGNIMAVGFSNTPAATATTRVTELTTAGVFVAHHTLNAEVYGMQGIVWDGNRYLITSHDTVNSEETIKVANSSFELQEQLAPSTAITEIEGIEFYIDEYYYNDIRDAPLEFDPDFPLLITESLVNTNYATLDPTITLTSSSSISITESLVNTNYTALDPTVTLTTGISIVEGTVNTNYLSLDPVVTLTSSAIQITESTVSVQYQSRDPSILLTPEPIGIVSTVCFNGELVDLSYNGEFNELEFNGTIQTTCNTSGNNTAC